jgi:hypothetical protein
MHPPIESVHQWLDDGIGPEKPFLIIHIGSSILKKSLAIRQGYSTRSMEVMHYGTLRTSLSRHNGLAFNRGIAPVERWLGVG